MTLDVLRETYCITRVPPRSDVPAWAARGNAIEFSSVSRTSEELSIVCAQDDVPADVLTRSDGWRGLKLRGPLDLAQSGVLVTVLRPLADARVPVFPVATHDTDYVFVRATDFARALDALRGAGHTVNA